MKYKYNPDKIRKLFSELFNALDKLRELANLSKDEFLRDVHKVASAIDMCNHVIAQNKLRTPEDYADTFRVLQEVGAFPKDFLPKLIEMARFRNRLVHIYWEVDNEVIYQILKEDISDLEKFTEYFTEFLKKKVWISQNLFHKFFGVELN